MDENGSVCIDSSRFRLPSLIVRCRSWLATGAVGAVALSACGGTLPETPAENVRSGPATGTPRADQPSDWFIDKAADAGLAFSYFNGASGSFYFPEMLPGGVGVLDYDNDGDLDVYLVQGAMLGEGKTPRQALVPPKDDRPLKGRLFRNDLQTGADGARTLRFTDVTDEARIDAPGYGMGVSTGDVDNNGCIDLFLTFFGSNRLYRNNCDGTFTDIAKESGLGAAGWSVSASFLDFDRDGWLDLYVGNYVLYDLKGDKPCTGLTGGRDYCTPAVYPPAPDRLYRNQGNGRFADVTATALQGGPFGAALGVVSADFDNDGWPDVYVANDGRENLLWMNQRNGTFRNTGLLSGSALSAEGKPEGSMGVDAGDFDNDGDDDLYLTHLPAEGNNLYVNDGKAMFEDRSAGSGLGPQSLGYTGFGTSWFDADNDGWLDLLAANGAIEAVKGRSGSVFPYDERNLLFRNLGNGRFEDATANAGEVFALSEVSRGAAFGDIDNDGDVDVVINQINAPVRLLINTAGNRKHWLGLRLVGGGTPRDMLGARVWIVSGDGRTLLRRAHTDGSYASANDPRVLAGLGDATTPLRVRVRWPSGKEEEWAGVAIDRWTTLKEGERDVT